MEGIRIIKDFFLLSEMPRIGTEVGTEIFDKRMEPEPYKNRMAPPTLLETPGLQCGLSHLYNAAHIFHFQSAVQEHAHVGRFRLLLFIFLPDKKKLIIFQTF
jgi:hypothetical protein